MKKQVDNKNLCETDLSLQTEKQRPPALAPKDRLSELFLSSSKEKCINSKRYTVYAYEIKRRVMYLFICSLFTFICAYIHRVSLMYSIISSLQKMHYIKSLGVQTNFFANPYAPIDPRTMQNEVLQTKGLYGFAKGLHASSLLPWGGQNETHSLHRVCKDEHAVEGDCPFVDSTSLIFTDVQEAFSFTLYVCSFWCVFACLPIYVYHLFCFLSPGWHLFFRNRVFLHTLVYLFCAYFVWWIVDQYYLSKILSFFYGFSIDRQGFCIHAQTRVFSYLSWYLSVFVLYICIFSLCTVFWIYKQSQIINTTFPIKDYIQIQSMHAKQSFAEHTIQQSYVLNTNNAHTKKYIKYPIISEHSRIKRVVPLEIQPHTNLRFARESLQTKKGCTPSTAKVYSQGFEQKHRGTMWWVCLLCAAFLSPPEGLYQLLCTFLFISLFELICCISYLSYSRREYTKLTI